VEPGAEAWWHGRRVGLDDVHSLLAPGNGFVVGDDLRRFIGGSQRVF
jgi:hypothetical protein